MEGATEDAYKQNGSQLEGQLAGQGHEVGGFVVLGL